MDESLRIQLLMIIGVGLLAAVFAVVRLRQQWREYTAARAAARTPHEQRLVRIWRWDWLGVAISYGAVIPLMVALFLEASTPVLHATIGLGLVGLAISALSWFLRGWYEGSQ